MNANIRGDIEYREWRKENGRQEMEIVPERAANELRIVLENGKSY